MLDMFIQMHTFYISGRTGAYVNNFTKVRAKYFRSWFIVDFVAVFPADYIVRALHWSGAGGDARSFRMLRLARLLRYARLLKLMNLKRVDTLIEEYQKKIGFSAMTVGKDTSNATIATGFSRDVSQTACDDRLCREAWRDDLWAVCVQSCHSVPVDLRGA